MTRTLHLGGPGARRAASDTLRGGALTFTSPRGLGAAQVCLIEALPRDAGARVLTGMDTEGAVALAVHVLHPEAEPTWFHLDAYVAAKVARVFADNGAALTPQVVVDVPPGPFDLAALAFPASSESQLMWDLLEGVHDALRPGGRLVAATDGKPGALRGALKKVFRNVTHAAAGAGRRGGTAFLAERRRATPALSPRAHDVRAVLRHRDGAQTTLDVTTRPGTFAYRRIDPGTRALAEWWTPQGDEDALLDLGCGSGVLGIAAALRVPAAHVTLVDSNARALDCARRNAERAGVAARATTLLRADLEQLPGAQAAVLANPPYFADFRIARAFVAAARDALRPGGRVTLVVRAGSAADAHAEILQDVFGATARDDHAGYALLSAVRRD